MFAKGISVQDSRILLRWSVKSHATKISSMACYLDSRLLCQIIHQGEQGYTS